MSKRPLRLGLFFAFCVAITVAWVIRAGGQQPQTYVPSEVIIKLNPSIPAADATAVRASLNAVVKRRFESIGAELWRINGVSVMDAISRFTNDPRVVYIEPNFVVRAIETIPNDPRFDELWGMHNTGQTGGTPDADIDAPEAWDLAKNSDVIVGVIDTGVDYNHVDLSTNIFVNAGEIAANNIDDDGNGFVDDVRGWDFINNDNNPMDDNGHGTHCSGTIGAIGNNGVGVAGVCWTVKIMPLKFLDAGGFGNTGDAIEAVEYGTMMGVKLTSNSWGGGGFSQGLLDAIEAAGDAGILFVAAAGNASSNNDNFPFFPASYDAENIISVASTDDQDHLSGFSNFGLNTVDLGAPGSDILSTFPGNSYGVISGTSMATPHVSGAVCLLWAAAPEFTAAEVKQTVLESVDVIPALQGRTVTGGRLNVFNIINGLDDVAPDAVADLAVDQTGSNHAILSWTASGDDADQGTASSYDLRYSTSPIDANNFDSATSAGPLPHPAAAGAHELFEVGGLAINTHYYFALVVVDEQQNRSGISNVPDGTTLGAPGLQYAPASLTENLLTGGSATQTVTIENVAQGTLDFSFSNTPAWVTINPASGRVFAGQSMDLDVTFNATGLFGGAYNQTALLHTNDPAHAFSPLSLTLNVTGAPDIASDPNEVDYGLQYFGFCESRDVIIQNIGAETLNVTSVTTFNTEFTVDASSFTLLPGAQRVLTVTFCPVPEDLLPSLPKQNPRRPDATLTLNTNDPDHPVFKVPLFGEGVQPPVIQVSPTSLSADLFTGGIDTQALHIENVGGTTLDFSLAIENMSGPNATVRMQAPVVGPDTKKDITPAAAKRTHKGSPYAPASTLKRELPAGANRPVITSASALEILLVHTGDVTEIQGALLGFPDVVAVDLFEASSSTPTLDDLTPYDGVILIANFPFGDKNALGDVLADYVDGGGGVVQTLATFIDPFNVGGRFLDDGYSPFTLGSGPLGFSNLGNFDANHPIMAGVSAATGDLLGSTTLTPGAQWVADWQIGQPFIATQGDHVVGANVFVADGGFFGGDVALILHNAVLWTAGAAWLTADPSEGSLPPGATMDVSVTFDATGLNGGEYSANLAIASNDPATPEVNVAASMHVTGAPDIDVPTAPLAYGEVFINGSSSKTIAVTNAGTDLLTVSSIATDHPDYSVDVSNASLDPGETQNVVVTFAPTATGPTNATLTITSDDPDEASIPIALSGTGVLPPIISVNPTSLEDSLFTGQSSAHTVTIGNSGASNLTFSIDTEEIEGAAAPVIKQHLSIPRSDGNFPRGTQAASARLAPGAHAKATHIKKVGGITAAGSAFSTDAAFAQATRFNLTQPEVLNYIGNAPNFIWAGDFASGDNAFAYAVDDQNSLMQIDTTNGTQTIIGTIVPFGAEIWTGMAFDPSDGQMYATGTDVFSSSLYLIDVANATSTRIGSINMPGIIACAIDSDGNMYAHDIVTDELVSIDKTTGIGTPIGSLGFDANFGQGMAYDGDTQTLYLAAFNNFTFQAELRVADVSTGNTSLIGVLGADVPGDLVQLGWLAIPGLGGVQWLSADPSEGIVPPGTSMDITVTFDAAGLFGGDYNANLLINNNDPLSPVVPVSAHLHVTGAPDIAVDQTPLDYGDVFIGGVKHKTVKVKNAGTDVLTVSSISTDHGDYSVSVPSLVLAPATSQDITVSYAPTSTGPSSATLTLVSDDPDEPGLTIALSGQGLLPPIVGVAPTSFSADLFTGESDIQTMTISNTGASNLEFSIDTEEATASSASRTMLLRGKPWQEKAVRRGGGTGTGGSNSRDPHTEKLTSPRTPNLTAADPAILVIQDTDAWGVDMGTFIFDNFGFSATVINSNQIASTDFDDFDLVLTVSDEGFSYYQALSSNVSKFEDYVSGGGVVQYQCATQGDNVTVAGGVQVEFGDLDNFNDILLPEHPIVEGLSSPLEGNSANHTTMSNLPAGAVQITETSGSGSPTTVEYEIGSGSVVLTGMTWEFLYNNGFEAGAMLGNAVAYSLSLAGVQWLEITPSDGVVAPGSSMDVSVKFDAAGLFGGDYAANILVNNNDPITPQVVATASLHVTGAPDILVPTDALHYGQVFVGGNKTKTLVVKNDGTDVLAVSSIVSSHADFTVDIASFNLAPKTSQNVVLTYAPTTVAPHSGNLTINSNDPDEPVVVIDYDGEGVEPPVITVSPTSLDEDLVTGEVADHTVTIGNTGGSNLEFKIKTEEVTATAATIKQRLSIPRSDGKFQRGTAAPSARMAPGNHAKASELKHSSGIAAVGSAFSTEAGFGQATRFNLNQPEVLNFIGNAPNFIWAGDFASGDNSFAYAVDDQNSLMQIDTTNGTQTIIGTIVPFGAEIWTGMAFDPTDGSMYATGTDIFSSSLYLIDVASATSTRIGSINMPGIIACAIDTEGNMYAHDLVTDELVSIDKTTGAGTPIGSLGFDANFGQGMGYDGETGTLYLAAFNNFTFQAELRVADVTTGSTALVGVLGADVPGGLVQLGWLAIPGLGGVKWLSLDPSEGIVPPGTSVDVTVTFDATGMFGGDYNANILVNNNDPLTPVVPVSAHLHVTGAPDIAVAPTVLDYGVGFVNGHYTQNITIKNQGTDLLTVNSVTTTHPDYTTDFAGASLAPGQSHDVAVTFAPTAPGLNAATLFVVSDDPDEGSVEVALQGEALMPPIVGIDPTAFSDDLFTGEVGLHLMTVSNTGASDLHWSIDTEEVAAASSASKAMLLRGKPWLDRTLRGGGVGASTATGNSRDPHTSTPVVPRSPSFAASGPAVLVIQDTDAWGVDMGTFIFDNFGISCTVINSGQIGSTNFDPFDLVLTVGDEDFNYYQALTSNVGKFEAYASAGGVVQYQCATQGDGVTVVGGVQVVVGPFESFNDILDLDHPIVAGLSSPLEGSSANHTHLANLPGGTNVITQTSDSNEPTTVEYAHGSGRVILTGMTWEFLYNFGFPAGAMLGNAVQYSLSLAGVQWLEIIPSSGTVPAGGSQGITVKFDANGLFGGDYAANILVNSNDPVTPTAVATANLHVTGATDIDVSTAPISFGDVFLGGSSSTTLVVSNPGTDVLMVSSISSSHPDFSVDASSFNLAPQTSQNVLVTFTPSTAAPVSGNLTINSNDPDEASIVIALDGVGLEPPVIAVSPSSISDALNGGDSAVHQLTIDNTAGGSALEWSIGAQFSNNSSTIVATSPIVGGGKITDTVKDPKKPMAAASHKQSEVFRFASNGQKPSQAASGTSLEDILANLNANYLSVTNLVPNRFDFFEGDTGNSIIDGGNDMYDGGNLLGTNLESGFNYSDNLVVSSTAFGPDGRYFTRKFPGLFVMVADMSNVDYFETFGNCGADGGGNVDGATLAAEVSGIAFSGFVKRIYNAFDPSINHIILVEENPGASHEFALNTDDDYHRAYNLSGSTRVYYILYASQNGGYVDNTTTLAIMEAFLNAMGLSPAWISVTPESGSVPAGQSAVVDVTLDATDLAAGMYNANLVVASNDPVNPEVTVPVSLAVDQSVTDVGDDRIPTKFALYTNRPNPFNPTTTIAYDLAQGVKVNLTIYDVHGREVKQLVNGVQPAGNHQIVWDGRNASNTQVASGVYFYRLAAGQFVQTKKMVLLK